MHHLIAVFMEEMNETLAFIARLVLKRSWQSSFRTLCGIISISSSAFAEPSYDQLADSVLCVDKMLMWTCYRTGYLN